MNRIYKVRFINPWVMIFSSWILMAFSVLIFKLLLFIGFPFWTLAVLFVVSFFAGWRLAKGVLIATINDSEITFTKRTIPFLKKEESTVVSISDIWYFNKRGASLLYYFQIVLKNDKKKYVICRDNMWKNHKDDFGSMKDDIANLASLTNTQRY